MKNVMLGLLFLLGCFMSLYVGFWVLGVGGIIDVINAIKATPTNAIGILFGIVKFTIAGPIGWLLFLITTASIVALEK